jgi:hypothetical protein
MKLLFAILISFAMSVSAIAQQSLQEEFRKDPSRSASNNVIYPGPQQKTLTPAPKGKKPFYLSHYGRHGSRFLTKKKDYEYLVNTLEIAQQENKLTALGNDVLQRVNILAQEAQNHWGDLTPLGGQQMQEISHRMAKNFPEIFKKRHTHVDARSTLVARCLLSMNYATMQLAKENPKLNITTEANSCDMFYMFPQDKKLTALATSKQSVQAYEAHRRKHSNWNRLLSSIFNDTAYVRKNIKGVEFNFYLFRLAGSIQNSGLWDKLTLYDIYTPDEIMENWMIDNAWWYIGFGPAPQSSGNQPFIQRPLLRKIIEQADSCIALPTPNVQLRFGHDTMVLPLVCLMGINGYDRQIDDLDSLGAKGWINHYIFPMASNLQLVFYRQNEKDKDVVVKVLLNENEATLPVETDMAPYYHWKDVRKYLLEKLDGYHNPI